ncbi:Aspartate decarboxylase [Candidatus Magnetoovum chiemensis]|nr:Aspartate decarboxylase [Candidatus Magnetoovum chiemensis]
MLKSKLHMAKVTRAILNYNGSLGVDEDLMEIAGLIPYEKILVSNVENGERFETYVIPGKRGSGEICLNGAAARKGIVGDRIIIFSFCYLSEEELRMYSPKIIVLTEGNKPAKS